jgi:Glyoxalase-like domain
MAGFADLVVLDLDCPHPRALAEFYRQVLGWDIGLSHDDYVEITNGSTRILFYARGWLLRSACDQGAQAVGDLGVLTCLVERSKRSPQLPATRFVRFPGVPSTAMMVVPCSWAEAVRLVRGGANTRVPAGPSTESPSIANTA